MRQLITCVLLLLAAGLAGCHSSSTFGGDADAKRTCSASELPPVGRASYCEQRKFEDLRTLGSVAITSRNGDVTATGADRATVTLIAYVYATAATEQRARDMVAQVDIQTAGENYYATGPVEASGENWGVTFDAALPARINLAAHSVNGDLAMSALAGSLRFEATNGDAMLAALAGSLNGSSTNGGTTVDLTGGHWDGGGANIDVTNGDLTFRVPAGYSAHFSLRATHGDVQSDFDGGTYTSTWSGAGYELTLGGGGATLRGTTTNGSGYIRRKP